MEVYDLRKLERALPNEAAKLRKAIGRWIAAHSVHSDISIAHAYVEEALYLHRLNRRSSRYAPTGLLHSSIVLYARALERHSDHRPAIKLGERFTDQQNAMHRKLGSLRDEALAHFGPSGPVRPISEDHALVIFENGTWQPAITARRSLFDRPFAEQLLRHLYETAEIISSVVEERRCVFEERFQTALEHEEGLSELMQSCMFNTAVLGEAAGEIFRTRSGRLTIIAPE